jgi:hypothetical protein
MCGRLGWRWAVGCGRLAPVPLRPVTPGRAGWTAPSEDFRQHRRNEQAMIATQQRALITEMFERVRPAAELIEDDHVRFSDTRISADELTAPVVWP